MALTPGSLEVFKAYAEEAKNWGGFPPVVGHDHLDMGKNPAVRAHLSDLKKKKLIECVDLGEYTKWIMFTDTGQALANKLGIDLCISNEPDDDDEVLQTIPNNL